MKSNILGFWRIVAVHEPILFWRVTIFSWTIVKCSLVWVESWLCWTCWLPLVEAPVVMNPARSISSRTSTGVLLFLESKGCKYCWTSLPGNTSKSWPRVSVCNCLLATGVSTLGISLSWHIGMSSSPEHSGPESDRAAAAWGWWALHQGRCHYRGRLRKSCLGAGK